MADRLLTCQGPRPALARRGQGTRTAVIYGQSRHLHLPLAGEQGRQPTVDELTRAAVREWLAQLADRGQENSTVRTRYKGLHRFSSSLVAEGELPDNPRPGSIRRSPRPSQSRCSPTTS